jgi:hypothetical protein
VGDGEGVGVETDVEVLAVVLRRLRSIGAVATEGEDFFCISDKHKNESVRRREPISVLGALVGRVFGVKPVDEQQKDVVRLRLAVGGV